MGQLSLLGILVGGIGAVVAAVVGRATGAGWPATLGLAALLAVGLYLWARDEDKGWGDLGQGIMVSVIVAIALLAVQRDADERTRATTERRDKQLRDADVRRERQFRDAEADRQRAAERANLQLTLTMRSDLRGTALTNRDLHGFLLVGRNLNDADLQGADLSRADLSKATLRGANLVDADLDGATLRDTDLRLANLAPTGYTLGLPAASLRLADLDGADLRDANIDGVDFGEASLLNADLRFSSASPADEPRPREVRFERAILVFADFTRASLLGANFKGAMLGGARFCSAEGLRSAKFDGAVYDAATRWPPGFDPRARGAKKVRGLKARYFKFRGFSQGVFARGGGSFRSPNRAPLSRTFPRCG